MSQNTIDTKNMRKYCVICKTELEPWVTEHCTDRSLVAITHSGLFRRKTFYSVLDGKELTAAALGDLVAAESLRVDTWKQEAEERKKQLEEEERRKQLEEEQRRKQLEEEQRKKRQAEQRKKKRAEQREKKEEQAREAAPAAVLQVLPGKQGRCDVCNRGVTSSNSRVISSNDFHIIIRNGFNPYKENIRLPSGITLADMMRAGGKTPEEAYLNWKGIAESDTTAWLVCETCFPLVERYYRK